MLLRTVCLSICGVVFVGGVTVSTFLENPHEVGARNFQATLATPSPIPTPKKEFKTTVGGYYAAVSEADFRLALEAVKVKDADTFGLLLSSGAVFMLPAGQEVREKGCADFCTLRTFQYPGKVQEYWTFAEALAP